MQFGDDVDSILAKRHHDHLTGGSTDESETIDHTFDEDAALANNGSSSGKQPVQVIPKMQYHRNNLTALSQVYNVRALSSASLI